MHSLTSAETTVYLTMGKPPSSRLVGRGKSSRELSARRSSDDIPRVYQEMLAEAHPSDSSVQGDLRPTKRRRVGERKFNRDTKSELSEEPKSQCASEDPMRPLQTVYDIDASEESDMEWEDVELGTATFGLPQPAAATDDEEPLQITLESHDSKGKQRAVPRRRPVTALEKKWRLDIHKTHVLCLLSHVQLRNLWCNDEEVQVAVSSGYL